MALWMLSAYAQETNVPETERHVIARRDSAEIYFHQSRSQLDPDYKGNIDNLGRMTDRIEKYAQTDSALRLSSVKVVGSASPEGSVEINRRLSHQRADRIFDYFRERTQLDDSITSFEFIGRDWAGLLAAVEKEPEVPYKDEVIETIKTIQTNIAASGSDSEQNLVLLKELRGGVPYRYLYKKLFPELRHAGLYVTYSFVYPERLFPKLSVPDFHTGIPTGAVVPHVNMDGFVFGPVKECKPFYMGLKTNLLLDALAIPSIGAEFYIGKNWAVTADWFYGWWDKNSAHRYWRAYGGNVGFRKWFGKKALAKPLTGHHLGLYAGVVTYDFEFGGKGYMGGLPHRTLWDRCNFTGGIEYGYALPVAKRLNIDFSVAVGYLGGKVTEYVPKDEIYIYQKTRHLNWFGPTKAEVSLVWLIGCDNYNRKNTPDY